MDACFLGGEGSKERHSLSRNSLRPLVDCLPRLLATCVFTCTSSGALMPELMVERLRWWPEVKGAELDLLLSFLGVHVSCVSVP